jgi:ABC-type sugar transport system substrate-binding protein
MTNRLERRDRRPKRLIGAAFAALVLAGSGVSAAGAGAPETAPDDAVVQELINRTFQTEMDSAELHPLIVEALTRATTELSAEQLETAYECWSGTDCTVPDGGDVVLAIVDAFGGNTWRRISKMETILQALTYPEIGRIISSDANFDLPTYQSQVRGAVAQGANILVGYNDFGDAMLPTFQDAQDQGAFVSIYVGPVPSADAGAIVTQIVTDTCGAGTSMADTAIELTGGEGTVAFFNGTPGNPQGAEWNQCALDQFAAEGGGVEQTFAADTSWTPAGAAEAASALIATGDPVDAILYDYADPLPGVVDTFIQAGQTPPALVTWTMNNDLFRVWEEAQGTDNEFELYYTNGLNWVARVSVTAVVNALNGNPSDAVINYPLPFVPAAPGMYLPDMPGDFPGTAIVPDDLVRRMIG